jgi:two-component system, cell cycle response regulator
MNSIGSPGGGDDRGAPWEDGPVLPDSQHFKPSVLFVDDDAYMRRLMTARLVHLDAEVEAVPSAQAAFSFLESHRPDLIITDAVMPGLDGFDLCRRLKNDPLFQSIPVVILTALKGDLRARSLEAGADDYLSKLEHEVVFRLRARLAFDLGVRMAALGGDPRPAEGGSLLVVSASRVIHAQMETHLHKDAILVRGCGSLAEALTLIQDGIPDVMALDLALGGPELVDWINRLRAMPGCAALPIMVLAAKGEEAGLAELEGHIQDRLPKPLDGQEGRHRVNLLLRIARM